MREAVARERKLPELVEGLEAGRILLEEIGIEIEMLKPLVAGDPLGHFGWDLVEAVAGEVEALEMGITGGKLADLIAGEIEESDIRIFVFERNGREVAARKINDRGGTRGFIFTHWKFTFSVKWASGEGAETARGKAENAKKMKEC
jgi:hypothetical protein